MFPAYGVVMLLFAGVALLLPQPQRVTTPHAEETSIQKKPGIGALLRQPAWMLFSLCVFLVWIATNASIAFLGVSLSAIGAKQGLIGFALTIGALTELPFMAFSGSLLRRYGPLRLLIAGMLLMTVRFFLLGALQAPQWAIAINMINGPAFAFFWNASVTYANRMAPTGYAGTAQGFLNATISLAGVLSSLLTGWLFDVVGAIRLFSIMGGFTLLALLLFSAGTYYLQKHTLQTGIPQA
jgi:PPP family 3-phenylpropionic acid transporter